MAHRSVCERLLLAFAPKLRKSADAEDQQKILDEETSEERPPGPRERRASKEVRMAMRDNLGVPSQGPR